MRIVTETNIQTDLREQAFKRLKKRQEFWRHLLVFLLVNAFLVTIWAVTNAGGFFWPIFPMVGWGIGLAMHGWDAYFAEDITDEDIDREMARMRHR
jgi:2TM domain